MNIGANVPGEQASGRNHDLNPIPNLILNPSFHVRTGNKIRNKIKNKNKSMISR